MLAAVDWLKIGKAGWGIPSGLAEKAGRTEQIEMVDQTVEKIEMVEKVAEESRQGCFEANGTGQ